MVNNSIPVDLFNPGQVFACLGFLEAADVLLGDAEGGFDWSDEVHVRFMLRSAGDENPFAVVLKFLATARVLSLAPEGSHNDTGQWALPTEKLPRDAPFPFPDPSSPASALLTRARFLVIRKFCIIFDPSPEPVLNLFLQGGGFSLIRRPVSELV